MQGPRAAVIRVGVAPSADHRRHDGFQHAVQRTLPAGMGGADHARRRIGQQDRAAIGGEHAQQQARPIGDQRVGLGCGGIVPGCGHGERWSRHAPGGR